MIVHKLCYALKGKNKVFVVCTTPSIRLQLVLSQLTADVDQSKIDFPSNFTFFTISKPQF